jgi:hypothetical protein
LAHFLSVPVFKAHLIELQVENVEKLSELVFTVQIADIMNQLSFLYQNGEEKTQSESDLSNFHQISVICFYVVYLNFYGI